MKHGLWRGEGGYYPTVNVLMQASRCPKTLLDGQFRLEDKENATPERAQISPCSPSQRAFRVNGIPALSQLEQPTQICTRVSHSG